MGEIWLKIVKDLMLFYVTPSNPINVYTLKMDIHIVATRGHLDYFEGEFGQKLLKVLVFVLHLVPISI